MEYTPFPSALHTFHDLLSHLRDCSPQALCNSYFTVDYDAPTMQSYKPDASVYTTDAKPFLTTIFGQVVGRVKSENHQRTFRIQAGPESGLELVRAFREQADNFAVAVLSDDQKDLANHLTPEVHACSDANRANASDATYMEIHVDNHSDRRCILYKQDGESLIPTVPVGDSAWPLRAGDWVLMQVTLHKWETMEPYHRRDYRILASRMKVLALTKDGDDNVAVPGSHAASLKFENKCDDNSVPTEAEDGSRTVDANTDCLQTGVDLAAGESSKELSDSTTLDSVDPSASTPAVPHVNLSTVTEDSRLYLEDLEAMETPKTPRKRRERPPPDETSDGSPAPKRRSQRRTVNVGPEKYASLRR
ncbi:hypothetical protein B0H11DRAFT_2233299 [Mycena galericulata]|nr:hypothetical protein B0H11DRAFT_2250085 [Mycena galericulata]KAJ7480522.1 hypothetical protein B0H11DRAFT_2233299 [Mycena galericulata]